LSTALENAKQAAWANLNPAVILNIQRQPGANIIGRGRPGEKASPATSGRSPRRRSGDILTDRTTTIRASVQDVQFTLVLTVASRRHGDFSFPPQLPRHDHSQRRCSAFSDWHVRR